MCVVLGVGVISVFDTVAFLACVHRVTSTFTTVSGSPTKGSSSSKIPVDPGLKRVWEEVEEEVELGWVDEYDIKEQASSAKCPCVVGQREDMNADVDGEKPPKAKRERTFKEVHQW